MQNMSYISYFKYVNEGGKITARTLIDLCTVIFSYLEEQEKKNEQYEANFKEIEQILTKLVGEKTKLPQSIADKPLDIKEFENTDPNVCDFPNCGKSFTKSIALLGHKRSHTKQTVI